MQKATIALIRAAKRARQLALQTRTAIVVFRDGQLVREMPQPEAGNAENTDEQGQT